MECAIRPQTGFQLADVEKRVQAAGIAQHPRLPVESDGSRYQVGAHSRPASGAQRELRSASASKSFYSLGFYPILLENNHDIYIYIFIFMIISNVPIELPGY